MSNHEFEIFADIAYYLYQQCFIQAGIDETRRGWPARLSEAISGEFPDENHLDAKAVSDLYNRINRLRADNITLQVMRISEKTLHLLARYALVEDYKTLNRGYRGIPAVYSMKPFGMFNFMRIVTDGILVNDVNGWRFTVDDEDILVARQIIAVQPFRMPGDAKPDWLKVDFKNNSGQSQTVYFAQSDNNGQAVNFISSAKLIEFFRH